jgi:hypothetical protein
MTKLLIDEATVKLAMEAITQYLSESPDPSEEAVEGLCDARAILRKALAEQPAQRTWVGLTDEEVDEVDGWTPEIHTVIRAIEAKLKGKNA